MEEIESHGQGMLNKGNIDERIKSMPRIVPQIASVTRDQEEKEMT